MSAIAVAIAVLLLVPGGRPRRWSVEGPSAAALADRVRALLPRRGRAKRRAAAVLWLDALTAELRAGRAPRAALQAVEAAPCPRAVAAARLGGDVVAALREDGRGARLPLLTQVAACWSVGESSGAGLVSALEQVLVAARADAEVRAEVAAQLAAPRATSRMLAVLPAVGLLLGSSMGASPVSWLLGTPVGMAVLVAGLAALAAGLWWTSRMVAAIERDLDGSAS